MFQDIFFRGAQLPRPGNRLQQQLHTPYFWDPANLALISSSWCSDVYSVPRPKHSCRHIARSTWLVKLFFPALTAWWPIPTALLITSVAELSHCVEWPYPFRRQDVYDKEWKVVPVHWGLFPVKRWFCSAAHCYFWFKVKSLEDAPVCLAAESEAQGQECFLYN